MISAISPALCPHFYKSDALNIVVDEFALTAGVRALIEKSDSGLRVSLQAIDFNRAECLLGQLLNLALERSVEAMDLE